MAVVPGYGCCPWWPGPRIIDQTIVAQVAAHPAAGINAQAPAPATTRTAVSPPKAPQSHMCECFIAPPLGSLEATLGRARTSDIRARHRSPSVLTTGTRPLTEHRPVDDPAQGQDSASHLRKIKEPTPVVRRPSFCRLGLRHRGRAKGCRRRVNATLRAEVAIYPVRLRIRALTVPAGARGVGSRHGIDARLMPSGDDSRREWITKGPP
jgi:hypothetical protein